MYNYACYNIELLNIDLDGCANSTYMYIYMCIKYYYEKLEVVYGILLNKWSRFFERRYKY